jgi:hypothetical protein
VRALERCQERWRIQRPLLLNGPSRPFLLLGTRAGTELACMAYEAGLVVEVGCEGEGGWWRCGWWVTGWGFCVVSCVVCWTRYWSTHLMLTCCFESVCGFYVTLEWEYRCFVAE